jgi:hypothetical protein
MSASEQPVAQALIRQVRLRGEGEGAGAGLRAAKLRRVSGFQWAFETRTLLAHATESENVDVVRFLVRSGVDPEKLGDEYVARVFRAHLEGRAIEAFPTKPCGRAYARLLGAAFAPTGGGHDMAAPPADHGDDGHGTAGDGDGTAGDGTAGDDHARRRHLCERLFEHFVQRFASVSLERHHEPVAQAIEEAVRLLVARSVHHTSPPPPSTPALAHLALLLAAIQRVLRARGGRLHARGLGGGGGVGGAPLHERAYAAFLARLDRGLVRQFASALHTGALEAADALYAHAGACRSGSLTRRLLSLDDADIARVWDRCPTMRAHLERNRMRNLARVRRSAFLARVLRAPEEVQAPRDDDGASARAYVAALREATAVDLSTTGGETMEAEEVRRVHRHLQQLNVAQQRAILACMCRALAPPEESRLDPDHARAAFAFAEFAAFSRRFVLARPSFVLNALRERDLLAAVVRAHCPTLPSHLEVTARYARLGACVGELLMRATAAQGYWDSLLCRLPAHVPLDTVHAMFGRCARTVARTERPESAPFSDERFGALQRLDTRLALLFDGGRRRLAAAAPHAAAGEEHEATRGLRLSSYAPFLEQSRDLLATQFFRHVSATLRRLSWWQTLAANAVVDVANDATSDNHNSNNNDNNDATSDMNAATSDMNAATSDMNAATSDMNAAATTRDDNDDACSICYRPLSAGEATRLPTCHHVFHSRCLFEAWQCRPSSGAGDHGCPCPYCGRESCAPAVLPPLFRGLV